jgi:hypothetical protein
MAIDPPRGSTHRGLSLGERAETRMLDRATLCRWMLIGAISLLISGRSAWAELPPTAYADMQQRAGEVLRMEVMDVNGVARRGPNEESHFTLTAKVVCTARSASGLTAGATIKVGYSTVLVRPRGWAGPGSIAMLSPGVYTAYLVKSGDSYAPAARGQSFIASPQGPEAAKAAAPC